MSPVRFFVANKLAMTGISGIIRCQKMPKGFGIGFNPTDI